MFDDFLASHDLSVGDKITGGTYGDIYSVKHHDDICVKVVRLSNDQCDTDLTTRDDFQKRFSWRAESMRLEPVFMFWHTLSSRFSEPMILLGSSSWKGIILTSRSTSAT